MTPELVQQLLLAQTIEEGSFVKVVRKGSDQVQELLDGNLGLLVLLVVSGEKELLFQDRRHLMKRSQLQQVHKVEVLEPERALAVGQDRIKPV